jgi:ATP adenylyltransferase
VQRLWTPWRRAFVEGSVPSPASGGPACFLCATPAAQDDRAALIVYRGPSVFVLLNLYPYNSGHLLVAPYEHTADLAGLDSMVASELMHVVQRSVGVLEQVYRPEACNLGVNLGKPAGAGVPDHLHVHIVPRWNGDTNFMPVIAGTKVLPETLDQTYARLAPAFKA